MVNTQKIANELNSKLNAIATTLNLGHTFKLMAHLGKAKQGNVIEGVLRVVNNNTRSKGGTSSGVVNNQVIYVAEFVFPSAMDNYYALKVEEAVNELVAQYHGYSFTIDTYNVIWELSLGTPKDYAVRGGVGSSLACAFTVTVSFSNNGLLNGIKNWTLDGVGIPYENEAVILDKDGVTLSVMEAKTQQTIPTSQRKQYKFTIPYDKNSTVCTTLQNDILNGNFRKTYTLAYNDGVVTYSAKVTLYKTGDMGTQKTGDATMMSVSFVDAGNYTYKDAADRNVTYKINLIAFPFGQDSENTLWFNNQGAQQVYMEGRAAANGGYRYMTAPNLGTINLTNVVFDYLNYVDNQPGTFYPDPNWYANLNYAIIKKSTVLSVSETKNEYFYYWVTNCTQGADGILLLDLKLDTIQTYMFHLDFDMTPCLIERAHLNRWINNNNGTVSFDGTPTSKLFAREEIRDVPKRIVSRQELSLIDNGLNANVPEKVRLFLDRYVLGWVYVTFQHEILDDSDVMFNQIITNYNIKKGFYEKTDDASLLMPYVTFAFPLYKTIIGDSYSEGAIETYMRITENNTVTNYVGVWDANTFIEDVVNKFKVVNDNKKFATYSLSIQVRQTPPINFSLEGLSSFSYDLTGLDDNGVGVLRIIDDYSISNDVAKMLPTELLGTISDPYFHVGLYVIQHQIGGDVSLNYSKQQVDTGLTYTFAKSSIVGANKNYLFNPKLLNTDYTELKLGQGVAAPYSYDAQKLNKQQVTLGWRETIFPGVVRSFLGLYVPSTNGTPNSVYNEAAFNGFVGCTAIQDASIPYNQDQMDMYLQQNKNFYLQQGVGVAGATVGGALATTGLNALGTSIAASGATAAATGAATGAAAGSVAPGIGTLVGAGVGLVAGVIQTALTINNMQNRPDMIKNLDGNPMLQIAINKGKTYLELSQALQSDLEKANNYMFMNGFTYNQIDNPRNYLHTRKYFNYIKAQIDDIQGLPLSNETRADIKQRFANGLRFWNYTTFATNGVQYDFENYELWLDN